jgi:dUTP pyrophosphatase
MEVKFLRTHPDAVLPTQNNKSNLTGDTGLDVTAVEDTIVPARGAVIVPVGLKLAYVTPGFWIRIESRSGLQFKHNIHAFPGIIDNQYRGDMGIRLINNNDQDYLVSKGDRIAQLVVYQLIVPSTCIVEQIDETDRGERGFGSSGK